MAIEQTSACPKHLGIILSQMNMQLTRAEYLASEILNALIGPPPPSPAHEIEAPSGVIEQAADIWRRLPILCDRLAEVSDYLAPQFDAVASSPKR